MNGTPLGDPACRGRALAAALEPFAGSVYFAPEVHAAYAELGFAPSPGPAGDPWGAAHWGTVAMTDGTAYFAGRGSLLGDVPGEVVAAAFGVFSPTVTGAAVAAGARIADAATIGAARTRAAVDHLVRLLGEEPEDLGRVTTLLERAGHGLGLAGRPMYAGVLAQGLPPRPLGRAWRLAERLREHRGDAHVAAFAAAGFDGAALQVLTERVAGMPPRTYARTRGWTDAELADAEDRLGRRGFVDAAGRATGAGRAAREDVERRTDAAWTSPVEALGDDLPELVGLLQGWGDAVRAASGYYPSSPQEAVMVDDVQRWARAHGLRAFGRRAS